MEPFVPSDGTLGKSARDQAEAAAYIALAKPPNGPLSDP